jgi:hypothetical protein
MQLKLKHLLVLTLLSFGCAAPPARAPEPPTILITQSMTAEAFVDAAGKPHLSASGVTPSP